MTTQEIKPTEEELIQRILTGDWTPGQVAAFEALHDPELTGESILIAGLEAELERLTVYVKAANEEITRQDAAIRELEESLSEARSQLELFSIIAWNVALDYHGGIGYGEKQADAIKNRIDKVIGVLRRTEAEQ